MRICPVRRASPSLRLTVPRLQGRLMLFDAPQQHKAYQKSIEAIENVSTVVDSLYEKIGLLRG